MRTVPAPKTLGDMLTGNKGPTVLSALQPKVASSAESVLLSALPPDLREMVGEQVQIMHMMQERPVVLAAPFVIRVK